MKRSLVVAVVGVLCAAAACSGGAGPTLGAGDGALAAPAGLAMVDGPVATPGGVRVAVVGVVPTDPLEASVVDPAHMAVLDHLYDGLTAWDDQAGAWVPSVADEVEMADDGLSWSFTLGDREFSDGTPLTAAHVAASLERVLSQPDGVGAARLDVVAAIDAVGPKRVDIVLEEPFAELPALLSSPVYGVVPDGAPDGSVRSSAVAEGAVVFVSAESQDRAVELFAAGDVDVVFVGADHVGSVQAAAVSAVEVGYVANVALPALSDVAVRAALFGGVDPTRVARAGYGSAIVPAAARPAMGSGAPPVGVEVAFVDDGAAGAVDEVGQVSRGAEALMAATLGAELADHGVETVDVEGLGLGAFVDLVASGEHQLVRGGWVGLYPSPDGWLSAFRSGSADNVAGYSSEAFDMAFAAARVSGAAQDYEAAAEVLRADAVVLELGRLRVRALVAESVHGLRLRHDGTFDSTAVTVSAD